MFLYATLLVMCFNPYRAWTVQFLKHSADYFRLDCEISNSNIWLYPLGLLHVGTTLSMLPIKFPEKSLQV